MSPDLNELIRLLTGEFDNFLQAWEEGEAKAGHPHERIHAVITPVTLPAFGKHVVHTRLYPGGDPTKTGRPYIWSLVAGRTANEVELKVYSFAEDSTLKGVFADPGKLEGLTPEKMRTVAGCEVYWNREGNAFQGHTRPGSCRMADSRVPGRSLFMSTSMFISRDELRIAEKTEDDHGNQVSGHPAGVPQKLKRCRFFIGWAVVQREDTKEYEITRDILLHDQGGRAEIRSGTKRYEIELAQLVYQNTKVPVFKLAFYEADKEESFAYTWANPEAERIGLNLRWIQAGFALK